MGPNRPKLQQMFQGLTPQQQQRYERMRGNKGAKAANQWLRKRGAPDPTPTNPQAPRMDYTNPQSVYDAAVQERNDVVRLNAPNMGSHLGNREVVTNPDGTITVNESLAPEQKALYEGQTQHRQDINDIVRLSGSQLLNQHAFNPDANNPYKMNPGGFQGMVDNSYKQSMARFDRDNADQEAQQMTDFRQRMADQGIPVGSELYNKQLDRMDQQKANARENYRQSAYNNAVGLGAQAHQQQLAGNQQAFGQNLTAHQLPFQRFQGLAGLAGQYNAPNFGAVQQFNGQTVGLPSMAASYYGQDQANQRHAGDLASRERIAQIGANASGNYDRFALARLQSDLQMDRWYQQQGFQAQGDGQPSPGPSNEEIAAQTGGAIVGGIGTGYMR